MNCLRYKNIVLLVYFFQNLSVVDDINYWIGLQLTEERKWTWVDGTIALFFDWGGGQPSGLLLECGFFNEGRHWLDHWCLTGAADFICESKLFVNTINYKYGLKKLMC